MLTTLVKNPSINATNKWNNHELDSLIVKDSRKSMETKIIYRENNRFQLLLFIFILHSFIHSWSSLDYLLPMMNKYFAFYLMCLNSTCNYHLFFRNISTITMMNNYNYLQDVFIGCDNASWVECSYEQWACTYSSNGLE